MSYFLVVRIWQDVGEDAGETAEMSLIFSK